jgi:hypothetical protein
MEQATDYLLQQGIMGVVILALVFAVIYLYKRLEISRDRRIEDHKTYTKAVQALQEGKIELQQMHTTNILANQKEVDKMVTHLTSTLEALIGALARGVPEE